LINKEKTQGSDHRVNFWWIFFGGGGKMGLGIIGEKVGKIVGGSQFRDGSKDSVYLTQRWGKQSCNSTVRKFEIPKGQALKGWK